MKEMLEEYGGVAVCVIMGLVILGIFISMFKGNGSLASDVTLLASHGYVRDGLTYRAEHANNDTIVFFCHFGLECVLLSHLLHISPMVLWHGTCAAPSSVTTLVTEERRPGIAYFRMSSFGDISHLYVKDEPPAFAARFCECYDNEDERHD